MRLALSFAVLLLALPVGAAELPNRQSAKREATKKCEIAGVPGVIIPGSDTCVKVSGGVSVEGITAPRHER